MNTATTFAAGSSITAMLAGFLVWFTHWPLTPMDAATAMDCAGLLITLFGAGGITAVGVRNAAKALEVDAAKIEGAKPNA